MGEFFFDIPLYVPIGLIVLGLGTFIYGNARVDRQMRGIGLGVLALGVLLWILSIVVDTSLEKSIDRTRAIAGAIDTQDWASLRELLDDDTRFLGQRGDAIADRAQELAGKYSFRGLTVIGLSGTQSGQAIDVLLRVLTEQSVPAPPTSWAFRFEQRSDGILLSRIEFAPDSSSPANAAEVERHLNSR